MLYDTFGGALATLDILIGGARPRLADATELTELIRRDDAFYNHELHWWTAPFRLSEAVPPDALASSSEW